VCAARHPPRCSTSTLKKLDAQEDGLLKLLHRWHSEADQTGRDIKRIVVACEAGRDGCTVLAERSLSAFTASINGVPSAFACPQEIRLWRSGALKRLCAIFVDGRDAREA
jgi:hypothetical protein